MKKLMVWWIPQIPGKSFCVSVETLEEANLLLDTLAAYDLFQLDNNIKPDFCNVGGLQVWDEDSDGEDTPGWVDWEDEETGLDFDNWRGENLQHRFLKIKETSMVKGGN